VQKLEHFWQIHTSQQRAMLENHSAGDGLAASRDFFAVNGEVGAVFSISVAEIGWNPQKAKRISYCLINFYVNNSYVDCAHVYGFGDYAVGDFALEIMVDGAAAADAPHNINAQMFASIQVNLVFGILVFTHAHGGRPPPIEPQGIRHLSHDSRVQDCLVDCHVHESIVSF
jgi:hypothetical protein